MQLVTRLHERLDKGELAIGVFDGLNSPGFVELLANGTELDFLGVDLQHAAVSSGDAVHILRALQAADPGATPIVRMPNHEKYWIEQSLDAGYLGLVAPIIESADEARALARRAHYPPVGARSMAGSVRAWLYEDYYPSINDRLLVLPQIESAPGLDHVEEIVSVDGISGVLVGPCDLSLSCGWFGEDLWSHSPFLAAVDRVLTACRERGKHAAIITGGDGIYHARNLGFNIISIGGTAVCARVDTVVDVNARVERLRSGS